MVEFVAGEHTYRSGKMLPADALHVARRVAPLLGPLFRAFRAAEEAPPAADGGLEQAPVAQEQAEAAAPPASAAETLGGLLERFMPLMEAISALSDDDFNYVMNASLAVTSRATPGGGWAPTWNRAARRPQFEDMEPGELIMIMVEAIKGNVGGFLVARSLVTSGAPPVPATRR